jgi:hypothetical protein
MHVAIISLAVFVGVIWLLVVSRAFRIVALIIAVIGAVVYFAASPNCEVIGRGNGTFSADIPAGEVRQINGKIKMSGVAKPRGVFSPRFAVNGVRAAIDDSDDGDNDILRRWVYGDCK